MARNTGGWREILADGEKYWRIARKHWRISIKIAAELESAAASKLL
jgi:hypothetical protein